MLFELLLKTVENTLSVKGNLNIDCLARDQCLNTKTDSKKEDMITILNLYSLKPSCFPTENFVEGEL